MKKKIFYKQKKTLNRRKIFKIVNEEIKFKNFSNCGLCNKTDYKQIYKTNKAAKQKNPNIS